MNRKEKGITLIALVITIIVLLILAAVTLSFLTGENGILNRSTTAVTETYHATVKEQIILGADHFKIEQAIKEYDGDIVGFLEQEGYIKENEKEKYYRVLVEDIASHIKTGKGTSKEDGDIYVIEENKKETAKTTKVASTGKYKIAASDVTEKEYVLRYYDKKGAYRDLLYLHANGSVTDAGGNGTTPGGSEEPEEEATKEVSVIEDLVDLQREVSSGNTQKGEVIKLLNSLDFNSEDSYRNANSPYEDPNTHEQIDLNGNEEIETVMVELTTGNGFTPIGTKDNQFEGIFNGNGYSIDNLHIKVPFLKYPQEAVPGGLFAFNAGTIKKLDVSGDIEADPIIGGIVGVNHGTVEKCNNRVECKALYVGGIAGVNYSTIKECNNYKGNVDAGYYVGGIVSLNSGDVLYCNNYYMSSKKTCDDGGIVGNQIGNGTISNCNNGSTEYALNVERASSYSGGIVHSLYSSNYPSASYIERKEVTSITIQNCNNYMTLGGSISCVAGIIDLENSNATNCDITITGCANYGGLKANNTCAGILNMGLNTKLMGNVVIDSCNNYGNINGSVKTGGILSSVTATSLSVTNSTNEGKIETGGSWTGGIIGDTSSLRGKLTVQHCTNSGELISTQITGGIIGRLSFSGNADDIIISDCENTNTITFTETSGYAAGGIIGYLSNSGEEFKISRCKNSGNINGGNRQSAGIIGISGGSKPISIESCTNSGNIYNGEYLGGIVGYGNVSSIKSCVNDGNITSTSSSSCSETGGIIGQANGQIEINDCTNNGIIDVQGYYVGGIIGMTSSSPVTITGCTNSKKVSSNSSYIGGIVGYLGSSYSSSQTITDCNNLGEVSSNSEYVAGIVGYISGSDYGFRIVNCGNKGNITGTEGVAGIVVGNKGEITNSFNTGNVSGTKYVSGILAYQYGSTFTLNISNVYNAGKITDSEGTNASILSLSYRDTSSITGDINHVYSLNGCADKVVSIKDDETTYEAEENEYSGYITQTDELNILEDLNTNRGENKEWETGEDGYPKFK